LFGASGRTDLLGDGPARQLALAQHASLARLAALPGEVTLHPTHGQGSFCTSGAADRTASTIATERRENPVLAEPDPERWAEAHLEALGPFPAYYRHMRPLNLAGPPPLSGALPELTAEEAAAMGDPPVAAGPGKESAPRNAAATVRERREPTGRRDGVWVVDARPREAFAAGHLPGALGIEWGQSFATWVGWLVPFDMPLVLVLEQDQDARAVQVALARIGVDRVLGVVRGLDRRADLGSFPLVDVAALDAALAAGRARQVLDVRAPAEWRAGHLPGALHRHLPDLVGGVDGLLDPAEDVWVACASGLRAVAAGSLLARHGFSPVVVGRGGIPDLVVG
jgi:hydroxyacylglutathione hydrolase